MIILKTLYNDERCSKLSNFYMLVQMSNEKVIKKEIVEEFSKDLKPH